MLINEISKVLKYIFPKLIWKNNDLEIEKTIYLTFDGKLRPFSNAALFDAMGFKFTDIIQVQDSDLAPESPANYRRLSEVDRL